MRSLCSLAMKNYDLSMRSTSIILQLYSIIIEKCIHNHPSCIKKRNKIRIVNSKTHSISVLLALNSSDIFIIVSSARQAKKKQRNNRCQVFPSQIFVNNLYCSSILSINEHFIGDWQVSSHYACLREIKKAKAKQKARLVGNRVSALLLHARSPTCLCKRDLMIFCKNSIYSQSFWLLSISDLFLFS